MTQHNDRAKLNGKLDDSTVPEIQCVESFTRRCHRRGSFTLGKIWPGNPTREAILSRETYVPAHTVKQITGSRKAVYPQRMNCCDRAWVKAASIVRQKCTCRLPEVSDAVPDSHAPPLYQLVVKCQKNDCQVDPQMPNRILTAED